MKFWATKRREQRHLSTANKSSVNVLCTPFRGNLRACLTAKKQCDSQHEDEIEATKCMEIAAKAQEPKDNTAENVPSSDPTATPTPVTISKEAICKPFNGDEARCKPAAAECVRQSGNDTVKFMQCMETAAKVTESEDNTTENALVLRRRGLNQPQSARRPSADHSMGTRHAASQQQPNV